MKVLKTNSRKIASIYIQTAEIGVGKFSPQLE